MYYVTKPLTIYLKQTAKQTDYTEIDNDLL